MADAIQAAGYGLPTTVQHFTETGVPFAYPPLALYLLAVGQTVTGVEWVALGHAFAALWGLLAVIALWFLTATLTDSRRVAILAATLGALSPGLFRWHVIAAGSVRGLAFVEALVLAYCAVRLFRDGGRYWLGCATVAWAALALTHPVYAMWGVATVCLCWVRWRPSLRGLAMGLVVGVGGLALISPWWLTVVARHGAGIFVRAAGTHGGLLPGLRPQVAIPTLTQIHTTREFQTGLLSGWWLAAVGGIVLLARREWFLPAWLLTTVVVMGARPRFWGVPAILISAVLIVDVLGPAIRAQATDDRMGTWATRTFLAAVVCSAAIGGVVYAANLTQTVGYDRPSLPPQPFDEGDRAAMVWASDHTPPDATFIANANAEEIPLYAERTVLGMPLGAEWTGGRRIHRLSTVWHSLKGCSTPQCLTRARERHDLGATHVYLSKAWATPAAFAQSDTYEVVFENEDAMILRITDGNASRVRSSSSSRSSSPSGTTRPHSAPSRPPGRD